MLDVTKLNLPAALTLTHEILGQQMSDLNDRIGGLMAQHDFLVMARQPLEDNIARYQDALDQYERVERMVRDADNLRAELEGDAHQYDDDCLCDNCEGATDAD